MSWERGDEVSTTCVSSWAHRSSRSGVFDPPADAGGTDSIPQAVLYWVS